MKAVCALAGALLFVVVDYVSADACTSGPGISVVECDTSSSALGGTGRTGEIPTINPVSVEPCNEYTYTGPGLVKYKYTGSVPFGITITGNGITGTDTIHIGHSMCENVSGGNKCHKYELGAAASPQFTLQKFTGANGRFNVRGPGSITFKIDNGACPTESETEGEETPTETEPATDACTQGEYFLDDTPRTWQEAREYCQGPPHGGEIAEFKTAEDIQQFKSMFEACATNNWSYWIGIRQGDTFLKHVWLDQSTVADDVKGSFSWYDTYEASGGITLDDQDCLAILKYPDNVMKINDGHCDNSKLGVVCKRNP